MERYLKNRISQWFDEINVYNASSLADLDNINRTKEVKFGKRGLLVLLSGDSYFLNGVSYILDEKQVLRHFAQLFEVGNPKSSAVYFLPEVLAENKESKERINLLDPALYYSQNGVLPLIIGNYKEPFIRDVSKLIVDSRNIFNLIF